MKEYEIVLTYLNGCAGAAHPLTTFEEAELDQFETEIPQPGKEIWKLDTGCVSYTYEFNEL